LIGGGSYHRFDRRKDLHYPLSNYVQ
jgi:hypothetical protein